MTAPTPSEIHAHLYAFAPFREAMTWSNTQGRNVERMSTGFRENLVGYATQHPKVGLGDVERSIRALREQLDLIEARCQAIERLRRNVPPTSRAPESRAIAPEVPQESPGRTEEGA